jgi:hypothetical protein
MGRMRTPPVDDELDEMVEALEAAEGTPDFEEIGTALLNELWRRLKDPRLVRELPGIQLMRLSSDYLKLRPKDKPEGERTVVTPLKTITDARIPLTRRLELLEAHKAKLTEELDTTNFLIAGYTDGTL